MSTAWWSKIQERDELSDALKVKLRLMFRGSITLLFRRMYDTRHDLLGVLPPVVPQTGYSRLNQLQKSVEVNKHDMIFIESALHLFV